MAEQNALKLKRTRNREYNETTGKRKVSRHAEYSVSNGKDYLAAIVWNGGGWRCCRIGSTGAIASAVSPVGLDKFRTVRDWAFHYLSKENQKSK